MIQLSQGRRTASAAIKVLYQICFARVHVMGVRGGLAPHMLLWWVCWGGGAPPPPPNKPT
jgi:hypothetical protein